MTIKQRIRWLAIVLFLIPRWSTYQPCACAWCEAPRTMSSPLTAQSERGPPRTVRISGVGPPAEPSTCAACGHHVGHTDACFWRTKSPSVLWTTDPRPSPVFPAFATLKKIRKARRAEQRLRAPTLPECDAAALRMEHKIIRCPELNFPPSRRWRPFDGDLSPIVDSKPRAATPLERQLLFIAYAILTHPNDPSRNLGDHWLEDFVPAVQRLDRKWLKDWRACTYSKERFATRRWEFGSVAAADHPLPITPGAAECLTRAFGSDLRLHLARMKTNAPRLQWTANVPKNDTQHLVWTPEKGDPFVYEVSLAPRINADGTPWVEWVDTVECVLSAIPIAKERIASLRSAQRRGRVTRRMTSAQRKAIDRKVNRIEEDTRQLIDDLTAIDLGRLAGTDPFPDQYRPFDLMDGYSKAPSAAIHEMEARLGLPRPNAKQPPQDWWPVYKWIVVRWEKRFGGVMEGPEREAFERRCDLLAEKDAQPLRARLARVRQEEAVPVGEFVTTSFFGVRRYSQTDADSEKTLVHCRPRVPRATLYSRGDVGHWAWLEVFKTETSTQKRVRHIQPDSFSLTHDQSTLVNNAWWEAENERREHLRPVSVKKLLKKGHIPIHAITEIGGEEEMGAQASAKQIAEFTKAFDAMWHPSKD